MSTATLGPPYDLLTQSSRHNFHLQLSEVQSARDNSEASMTAKRFVPSAKQESKNVEVTRSASSPTTLRVGGGKEREVKKNLTQTKLAPLRPEGSLEPLPRKRIKFSQQEGKFAEPMTKADDERNSPSSSPSPPRLPADFQQVTSPSFLTSTSTLVPGVYYLPHFISPQLSSQWYASLLSLPGWHRPTLSLYGKQIIQSRSIIAFSKLPGLKLKYSGQEVEMKPWPEVLRGIEKECRNVLGEEVRFNHAMLNYYPDGQTHIGRHSDNLENKVIVTISLGAHRTWVMTKRPPKGAKAAAKRKGEKLDKMETHRWTVQDGSLLLMQGRCQEEWYHEIPKEKRIKEGRISVTLRQLVYD